ncbi:hypothetical protein TREES_T100000926 [Tupaia chinensis]|uniref:Uncharacterized protein n=1 Tax=Tupaia chinensis TaxID=246437 RepID=L9JD06_TUPCH|nr:hypothetical protein TREES_T100000926 [Tupaia chinensis]
MVAARTQPVVLSTYCVPAGEPVSSGSSLAVTLEELMKAGGVYQLLGHHSAPWYRGPSQNILCSTAGLEHGRLRPAGGSRSAQMGRPTTAAQNREKGLRWRAGQTQGAKGFLRRPPGMFLGQSGRSESDSNFLEIYLEQGLVPTQMLARVTVGGTRGLVRFLPSAELALTRSEMATSSCLRPSGVKTSELSLERVSRCITRRHQSNVNGSCPLGSYLPDTIFYAGPHSGLQPSFELALKSSPCRGLGGAPWKEYLLQDSRGLSRLLNSEAAVPASCDSAVLPSCTVITTALWKGTWHTVPCADLALASANPSRRTTSGRGCVYALSARQQDSAANGYQAVIRVPAVGQPKISTLVGHTLANARVTCDMKHPDPACRELFSAGQHNVSLDVHGSGSIKTLQIPVLPEGLAGFYVTNVVASPPSRVVLGAAAELLLPCPLALVFPTLRNSGNRSGVTVPFSRQESKAKATCFPAAAAGAVEWVTGAIVCSLRALRAPRNGAQNGFQMELDDKAGHDCVCPSEIRSAAGIR